MTMWRQNVGRVGLICGLLTSALAMKPARALPEHSGAAVLGVVTAAALGLVFVALSSAFVLARRRWTWALFATLYALTLWYYADMIFTAFRIPDWAVGREGFSEGILKNRLSFFWGIPQYMAIVVLCLPGFRGLLGRERPVGRLVALLIFPSACLAMMLGLAYLLAKQMSYKG